MFAPVCLRCRRPVEESDDGDDLVLTLDGPVMLQAIRELRAEPGGDQELLDAIASGLCPTCGRER